MCSHFFSTKEEGPRSLGSLFPPCICAFQCISVFLSPGKPSHVCQTHALILPLDVGWLAPFLSVFAAGDPCVTDRVVPKEAVAAVTDDSLVVACPSQLPGACISVMSRVLMVSTFPGSQNNVFEPNVQEGAGCQKIVVLNIYKAPFVLGCKL